jgi:AraC-like DNA-binding protein
MSATTSAGYSWLASSAAQASSGTLWFHVVTAGSLWLDDARRVGPGDLALVPHGSGHALRSEAGAPAPGILDLEREAVSERYEILRHGGGGELTTLICGAVRFDHPAARDLVAILPATVHIEADTESIQAALRLMGAEARSLRPGGEAVITRLADILVIQAIRAWMETDPAARTGWLGALQDPQIGRAISLIQREPARHWTVASLARELAMSRSAFAARFTELVGEPAMQYLTRWRMNVAFDALRDDGRPSGSSPPASATAPRLRSPARSSGWSACHRAPSAAAADQSDSGTTQDRS